MGNKQKIKVDYNTHYSNKSNCIKYFNNNKEHTGKICGRISKGELGKSIDSLKINKADGSDRIPSEYFELYKNDWVGILRNLCDK